MPILALVTHVAAPVERCFDLSRSIDLHRDSFGATGERAVAGVTSGLIGPGESVTWEATHFLVRQRLTSRITAFDRPRHFRDSMVSGAFRRFDHDHVFEPDGHGGTVMRAVFDFDAPRLPLATAAFAAFTMRSFSDAENERLVFGATLSTDAPLTPRSGRLRSVSGSSSRPGTGDDLGNSGTPFSSLRYRDIQRSLSHLTLAQRVLFHAERPARPGSSPRRTPSSRHSVRKASGVTPSSRNRF